MIKPDARFLRRFGSALFGWLSLFELLAALFGLRGLLLTHPQVWRTTGWLLVWQARHLRRSGSAGSVVLLLTFLPALLLHLLLATLRNRQLDPRRRLLPGSYTDRNITRLDIPTANGPVPALHIVPAGGARAVVCVAHGSGCNKTFYAWELVDALLARGLALLLIDLDGHGESCRPQAFPGIVQNIVGPVAWLRTRYEQVGVIGISLGGCIAAHAVANGTVVDALVILEAPPWLQLSRRQVIREVIGLLQPTIVRLTRAGSPYWIARAWESPRIRARIGTHELIAALDLVGSLRRITSGGLPATGDATGRLPLLLVYGAWDAIISPQQAAQVRQAVPPGGTFHLVRYATHLSLPIDPRTLALVGHRLEAILRQ
jgi:alpha-beta hydrolase superfamily lysophospholipase